MSGNINFQQQPHNRIRMSVGSSSASKTKTIVDLVNNANSKVTEIEIGRKSKFIHQKIKMTQYSILLANLIGIFCCVVWVMASNLVRVPSQ